MNISFFLKNLIVLLIFGVNTSSILSMVKEPNDSTKQNDVNDLDEFLPSSQKSSKNKYLKKPVRSLGELAAVTAAKKASEIYDQAKALGKDGHAEFEKYLTSMPEDIKINVIYSILITELNRTDIFINKIKELFEISPDTAFTYFSNFCKRGQKQISSELISNGVLNKNMVVYFIYKITDFHLAAYLLGYLPFAEEESFSKKAKKCFSAFKKELKKHLELCLGKLIKSIEQKVEIQHSDKMLVLAPELINLAEQDFHNLNGDNFINRFKALNENDQKEFLRYYFLSNSESSEKLDTVFSVFQTLIVKNQSENLLSIYNNLRLIENEAYKIYPEARELIHYHLEFDKPEWAGGRSYLLFLLDFHTTSLAAQILKRLIAESQRKKSYNFLMQYQQEIRSKFEDPANVGVIYRIRILVLLIYADLTTNQENYFKNLYNLFKKFSLNLLEELNGMILNEKERELKINNYIVDFRDYWFEDYKNIAAQYIGNEQLSALEQDFKSEILGKFENK